MARLSILNHRLFIGRDYRKVFSTPAGKRVLADLGRFCGAGGALYVEGDPYGTCHMTGRYRVLQRIAAFMGQDETVLTREIKEIENAEQGQEAEQFQAREV